MGQPTFEAQFLVPSPFRVSRAYPEDSCGFSYQRTSIFQRGCVSALGRSVALRSPGPAALLPVLYWHTAFGSLWAYLYYIRCEGCDSRSGSWNPGDGWPGSLAWRSITTRLLLLHSHWDNNLLHILKKIFWIIWNLSLDFTSMDCLPRNNKQQVMVASLSGSLKYTQSPMARRQSLEKAFFAVGQAIPFAHSSKFNSIAVNWPPYQKPGLQQPKINVCSYLIRRLLWLYKVMMLMMQDFVYNKSNTSYLLNDNYPTMTYQDD